MTAKSPTHLRKFVSARAADRKIGGLNEYQKQVLKAAEVIGSLFPTIEAKDVVGCLAASGLAVTARDAGCVGASLKALADRGHLCRNPKGSYILPGSEPAPSAPARINTMAPSQLASLRRADLVAGRAPVARRRTVNLEEPLWPEEANR